MSSVRSAALQRMGISEWQPRVLDAEAAFDLRDQDSVVEPDSMSLPAAMATESAGPSVTSTREPVPVTAPRSTSSSVASAAKTVASPASQAIAATHGLRGRVLRVNAESAILVLALAEKNARDALLHPDTAAGALLNAMLAALSTPASVALIGVERGEPIAVPATILVLGERSARALLGNEVAMPLRGRVHLFGQSRVVVSYHPDELRLNSSLKRLAWEDLRLLAGLLPSAGAAASEAC